METEKRITDGVTPMGRVSYPAVFKPKLQMDKIKLKFELTLVYEKQAPVLKDDKGMAPLRKLLFNAAVNGWGSDPKKWPKFEHPAIKDGDKPSKKTGKIPHPGHWYIVPKSNEDRRPQVLNRDKSVILEGDGSFYGGCFAEAYVNAYAYEGKGTVGVQFGLNAVRKLKDGPRFDGRKDATEVFPDLEDGSEDESNYDSNATETEENSLGF